MSGSSMSIQSIITTLQAEGLLDEDSGDAAADYIERRAGVQPWYIRTMVGFGAWLASLLLIGFVAGLSIATESGYLIIGLVLIAGAIFARRQFDSDFAVQCTLASSLAGQALFAYGLVDILGGEDSETFLTCVIIVSSVLFFAFPDRIHRVIMVLFATSSLTILLYSMEATELIPALGPIFAAGLIVLHNQVPGLVANGYGAFVRPMMNGLMLSAFGVLLLSTVYVLPELQLDFQFYPRPWISTILLGVLFLYVGTQIWPMLIDDTNKAAIPVIYCLMVVIIACAWNAPGLLLALIVVMLGANSGSKTFIGAGIGFLAVFLATYFYGIEVTLLAKSITLTATGIAILISRWIILKVIATPGQGGMNHA